MADDAIEAEFAAAQAAAAATIQAAIIQAQATLEASVQSSQIRANADVESSKITGQAHVQASTAMAQAETTSASTRASADIQVANLHAGSVTDSSKVQADAEIEVATLHSNATITAANSQAQATTTAATTRAGADVSTANIQAGATTQSASTRAQADIQTANVQASASIQGSELGLQGTRYSSDKQLQGVGVRETGENTRLSVKLAFAQGKWDQVFPYVQDALSGKQDFLAGTPARWTAAQAAVGPAPKFKPTGVFTEQQIQQQLNSAYSRIALAVQSKTRTSEIDLAGRGFSSGSPIMDAISMGFEGYGIVASADEESKIRIGAAQANADQVLKSQTEAIEYYLRNLAAYTDLEKNAIQLDVGVLGAAAQLLSGVV